MSTLILKKESKVLRTLASSTISNTNASDLLTVGGSFTVSEDVRIKGLGWGAQFTTNNSIKQIGLWTNAGILLGSINVINVTVPTANFVSPITLKPGTTYVVAAVVYAGELYSDTVPTDAPFPFTLKEARNHIGGSTLTFPENVGVTGEWPGNLIVSFEYSTFESKAEPPEPVVTAGSKMFTVSLPKEWMPFDLVEWDLQFQRSFDNSLYGKWLDLGTFPGVIAPEDNVSDPTQPDDPNAEPEPTGSYPHTSPDTIPPYPFYRYRYRIRTKAAESDWSEAAYAGQVRDAGQEALDRLADPSTPSTGSTGTFSDIVANSITAGAITSNGSLTAVGLLSAGSTNFPSLTFGVGVGSSVNAATYVGSSATISTVNASNVNIAGQLSAGSAVVSGLINGNTLTPGAFNGVAISNGEIDGQFIKANTVTARQIQTGFLDANVSSQAFIDAGSIQGGELRLGGTQDYHNFRASSGDLLWPWMLEGNAVDGTAGFFTSYPQQITPPTLQKFAVNWDTSLRIDIRNGVTIGSGEVVRIINNRTGTNNPINIMTFTVSWNLPTGVRLILVDQAGQIRPLTTPYSRLGSGSETIAPSILADSPAFPSGLGFMLQCTSTTTVPSSGSYFVNISNVHIERTKGSGILSVYDASNLLRAEVTADYIRFNKPFGVGTTQPVFQVDNVGTWLAADSLTVGSNKIANLSYPLRDLSGPLVINPRFENLRITNPAHVVPSDWTYLQGSTTSNAVLDDTNVSYRDGVYPQWQSLVSGRVLQMIMNSGSPAGTSIQAVSHKREIRPDITFPFPLSMSGFFRTPLGDPDLEVNIYLYYTSSPSDIQSNVDIQGDTLLGKATATGLNVTQYAQGTEILFQEVKRSFYDATGVGGDTMKVSVPGYVYLVLEAKVKAGRPNLTSTKVVEWDNVDLAVNEGVTSSDNQATTDLARRITSLQTVVQYLFTGTKAVLPDLATGSTASSLRIIAVN